MHIKLISETKKKKKKEKTKIFGRGNCRLDYINISSLERHHQAPCPLNESILAHCGNVKLSCVTAY